MCITLRRIGTAGWAVTVISLVSWATSSWADDFHLASGGILQGEWLNPQRQPGAEYVIRTERGLTVKLGDRQVLEVQRLTSYDAEYKLRLARCGDSADEHYQLAQWCQSRKLLDEQQYHLAQAIEINPNHEKSRHALGQNYINGQWTTSDDLNRADGYLRYKGRWRTIQEIELFEAQEKRKLLEKEWAGKLKRWRQDLGGPRSAEAWQAIAEIKAPEAVRPISQAIGNEPARDVKMHYTQVLANINSADSVAALVYCSLNDPDIEMFHDCLKKLIKMKPPALSDTYIGSLSDANNTRVNRAAMALSVLKDKSAISPLIDALVTRHPTIIGGNNTGLPAEGYSATFSKGTTDALGTTGQGSSSLQKGDDPKLVIVQLQNEDVLVALNKLSGGADFGFDAKAWRYWLAQEKKRESTVNAARRDGT